jgi:hypothetical protein
MDTHDQDLFMWHRLTDLWNHNRIALIAFVTVVCLAGYFGARTTAQVIYWADPTHQDQTLAGWMTPRYVARSYNVPPEVMREAFFLDPNGPPKRTSVDAIAAINDVSVAELQSRVDEAVTAWRAENPRPTP